MVADRHSQDEQHRVTPKRNGVIIDRRHEVQARREMRHDRYALERDKPKRPEFAGRKGDNHESQQERYIRHEHADFDLAIHAVFGADSEGAHIGVYDDAADRDLLGPSASTEAVEKYGPHQYSKEEWTPPHKVRKSIHLLTVKLSHACAYRRSAQPSDRGYSHK